MTQTLERPAPTFTPDQLDYLVSLGTGSWKFIPQDPPWGLWTPTDPTDSSPKRFKKERHIRHTLTGSLVLEYPKTAYKVAAANFELAHMLLVARLGQPVTTPVTTKAGCCFTFEFQYQNATWRRVRRVIDELHEVDALKNSVITHQYSIQNTP